MEAVVTTPCKHYFHRVCINRVDLPQCPLCSCQLPFSWFVPANHPCAEHGFRVVLAQQYRPQFPGGPSRGTCGYPLRQPPPLQLYGPGNFAMASYLHRILPSPDADSEPSPEATSPVPMSPERRPADSPEEGSSASESSSEESGSEDGDDAEEGPIPKHKHERRWAYGALGRMRILAAPPPAAEAAALDAATLGGACGREASDAGSADAEQRNPQVLFIGDHL